MAMLAVQADVISYNSAITSTAGTSGAWKVTLSLLAKMAVNLLQKSLVSWNASISSISASSEWQRSQQCLRQLLHQLVQTDIISCNADISALEGNWEKAIHCLSKLHTQSLCSSIVTYNTVIRICHEPGLWREAITLMEDIEETVTPTVVTYGTAISTFQHDGRWQAALVLMDMAQIARLPPNVIIYSAAITSCEESENWQQALALLEKARSQDRLQAEAKATA